jgi:hypothetical protein
VAASSTRRWRRIDVLDGPSGNNSMTAAANPTGSPAATNRPAAPGCEPRISTGPPAADATTGTPEASASITAKPNGSGSVDGNTSTSRSAISSAMSPRDPNQCTPAIAAARPAKRQA